MKPMTEDLPFPDLAKLTPDRKNARIVMPAYADAKSELTAVLQYIYQSILFGVGGNEEYATTLESIAIAEMKHLDLLAEALARMGVTPVYSHCPPEKCNFYNACAVNYSMTPAEMIAADITAEKEAIAQYESMLECITEPTLGALISRIVLDERLHLQKFKDIYCELLNGGNN